MNLGRIPIRAPEHGSVSIRLQGVGAFRVAYGDRISERAEFRCACGYGIVVSDTPPSCPMCQANVWQRIAVGREAA